MINILTVFKNRVLHYWLVFWFPTPFVLGRPLSQFHLTLMSKSKSKSFGLWKSYGAVFKRSSTRVDLQRIKNNIKISFKENASREKNIFNCNCEII